MCPLIYHLSCVWNTSKTFIGKANFGYNINPKVLYDISSMITIGHDFGKGTAFFQDKIRNPGNDKNNPIYNHSLISAIFTYHLIEQYEKTNNLDLGDMKLIAYFIIKNHHTGLKNILDEQKEYDTKYAMYNRVLTHQIANLDRNNLEHMYNVLLLDIGINLQVNLTRPSENNYFISVDIDKYIKKINRRTVKFHRHLKKSGNGISSPGTQLYHLVRDMYSTLTRFDIYNAAGISIPPIPSLNPNTVLSYKNEKFPLDFYYDINLLRKNYINIIREQIFHVSDYSISSFDLSNRILTINVPTGTGKTITSTHCAIKLKNRLESNAVNDEKYRIVYCLPFLSVVDQVEQTIHDIFDTQLNSNNSNGTQPYSEYVAKYHCLSTDRYTTSDKQYDEYDSLTISSCNESAITVTTFVQLFDALFSNKKRAMLKYSNLRNSIIILDEVQAIPIKYWGLVREELKRIAEELNIYIILSTATLPLIFPASDTVEIVPQKKQIFDSLNRIVFDIDLNLKDIDDLTNEILTDINTHPDKDVMLVVNTINTSIKMYNRLKSRITRNDEIYYLSTNLPPIERLKRIEKIKDKSTNKRKIIISTQLIEAGVDIDVDIIYRDLAPMDSINQTAGRCNRNGNSSNPNQNKVRIFNLDKSHNTNYQSNESRPESEVIYDHILIKCTEDVLKNYIKNHNTNIIPESAIYEINHEYYNKVQNSISSNESEEIKKCIATLKFKDVGDLFSLINDDYETVSIFIELDDKATRYWQEFVAKSNMDIKTHNKLSRKLQNYIVNISTKYLPDNLQEINGIYCVPKSQLNKFYNTNIGVCR